MSIATEITRLNNAKAAIKSAIEAKGVEVPQDAKIDIYADYIAQIPQGGGTEYEPICFTSLEDGNTFKLNKEIAISVDGKQTWQTLAANTNSPVINTGEKIYFKATENASPFSATTSNYYKFSTEKTCNVSGHPYSLYAKLSSYSFSNLFSGTNVVDASGLTLEDVVSHSCYYNMFNGCTSLVTAPELPATTLVTACYSNMFNGCTSLVTAPELPATTLAEACYYNMFYKCTSLVTAPELPATTLVTNCYKQMFNSCSRLNYIKALFTTKPSSAYTDTWVLGVNPTGTFVKNRKATWTTTGDNGIPNGWTVVNDNA